MISAQDGDDGNGGDNGARVERYDRKDKQARRHVVGFGSAISHVPTPSGGLAGSNGDEEQRACIRTDPMQETLAFYGYEQEQRVLRQTLRKDSCAWRPAAGGRERAGAC